MFSAMQKKNLSKYNSHAIFAWNSGEMQGLTIYSLVWLKKLSFTFFILANEMCKYIHKHKCIANNCGRWVIRAFHSQSRTGRLSNIENIEAAHVPTFT